ncbi:Rha family transcriptional regulator [Acinetobacter baumannii]|uniref:phage regulatory CII family protein n=1 Tax=Acinetobacter baumannii TaxID=470 RepID=UPI00189B1837|nr:phage regulatory CII family protein [Acinetobacter baumannii]MBF6745456.1 Rha family transcriptional regulator [Acinetobacter baumannii]MBF6831585.1 Rha family transcriptional regulator [Acinetobacter baumannii]MBF6839077.1 Rha family transcriptional regulator [Acinetobacter baumannii]MBF6919821.1 Rha family transcriptional regulator [Acinetobacter baumannii]MBF6929455.1 Rha family transcriptional regulator [Acinetobacter baumannii]
MLLTLNERRERAVLSLEQALKAAVSNSNECLMAQIAENNGFNINTFRSAINPTTTTHKANIHHFEAILSETKDERIMDSVCAIHGNAAWFELPHTNDLIDANFIASIGLLAREQGDLAQSVAQAVADKIITNDEAAIIQKDVLNLIRVAVNLYAMVEAFREKDDE